MTVGTADKHSRTQQSISIVVFATAAIISGNRCDMTRNALLISTLLLLSLLTPSLARSVDSCGIPSFFCRDLKEWCVQDYHYQAWYQKPNCPKYIDTACTLYNTHCLALDLSKNDKSWQKKQWEGECLNIDKLKRDSLTWTNEKRKMHRAAPLTEDWVLTAIAQAYAEKIARDGNFVHSFNGFGENMHTSFGQYGYAHDFRAKECIDSWYDEIENWDFHRAVPRGNAVVGHFTQLVWRNSTRVGHGFASSEDCTKIYIVANYDPPGNYIGRFKDNVLPPLFRKSR